MTSDHDRLRQLFIEKISGMISEADEKQLQQWLSEDRYARDTWNDLVREAGSLDVDQFMEDTDPQRDLFDLKASLSPRRSWRLYSWQTIAAGLLLAAAGLYFINGNKTQLLPAASADGGRASAGQQAVQLTVEGGQAIDLSQGSETTISLDGMQLRTSGNELHMEPTDDRVRMNMLYVPAKEQYRIVLPDGSKVWLNAASRLRFPSRFSGENRVVWLDGEGYFEIQAKTEQPFIVHTDRAQIQVLGTSFNLRSYAGQPLYTALIDGGVRLIADNGRSLQLAPGDAAEYTDKGTFHKSAFDPDEILAWRDGLYYFHNTSLAELVIIIERWYGLSVTFERPETARQTLTGVLEKDQIGHFLSDLETSLGIRHTLRASTLHFN